MSFADKGAVADIEPAFFIGYLHQVKATGTLKFEDAPIQRAIYFREGRILFSSSNAPEDQLGAILVAGGKIGQEQFDAIVAALEPKQSIAAALAQGGHVSQRDIGDAARKKVEQIVGSCCAQTTGRYEFEDGVLPKGALDLKLTTEKVLVSAFDVLEPSGFLIRVLKSPMAVLAQGAIVPVDPDLVRLREAFDGVSNLADIGGTVGLPLAATEARAAVLVVMGAATVVTSQIEEMSLPDTGETSPGLPAMNLSEESEQIEAETISFGQASAEMPSGDADSTLVMSAAEPPPPDTSGDATLVMGAGPAPGPELSESGLPLSSGLRRERATTQDLDAVKELIGSPTPARPTSANIPTKRWEPVLSSAGRPGREATGLAGMIQKPVVRQVGGAILLVVVLAVGWLGYSASQNAPRPLPPPVPSPSVSLPAPTVVAEVPSGSPAAVGAPPAAATVPTTSTPALTKAVPTPAALPPTTPAPKATPTPKPAPTPAPVRPVPTPTPAPMVARATPAPPAPVAARPAATGSGYEAMKAGRLADAGTIFVSAARSRVGEFSVQLLVACSAQTIEKAIQNDPSPDLFILPATLSGKACHRLMRGYYRTEAEGARAIASLPAYYVAEGAKPRAVAIKAVLP